MGKLRPIGLFNHEELLAMESLQGKMQREELYDSMLGVIKRHKLPWRTLANVTTEGLPNLTGKKHWVAQKNSGEGERRQP